MDEVDGCLVLLVIGYLLGMCLAVVLSWESNHAILWATFHGLLSWLYVGYHVLAGIVT